MKRYKDYFIAALIGFCVGWLAIAPEVHLGMRPTFALIAVTVIGCTGAVPFGLLWCSLMGRKRCTIRDLGKFSAVGILNTVIDFGLLNLFMFFSGLARGHFFILAKTIAFTIASINGSYFNARWTFRDAMAATRMRFPLVAALSIVGAAINVGITAIGVEWVTPLYGISATWWANIASLAGTVGFLVWSVITWRVYVFTRHQ